MSLDAFVFDLAGRGWMAMDWGCKWNGRPFDPL
jgi:hypothetical protein